MELTDFTFKLLVLFLPGLVCGMIVDTYTEHKPRDVFNFCIRAVVYGFSSYFLYWAFLNTLAGVVNYLLGLTVKPAVYFIQIFSNPAASVSVREVVLVCITAVFFGLCLVVESTYKWGFRIAQNFRITKKFGELDVWGYALNAPNVEWVTVRDLEYNLVYDGWVSAFSDDGKSTELLLRDVQVYSNIPPSNNRIQNVDAVHLYDIPAMYLSRDRKAITLEFRV
jgi:hypothetical protein